MFDDDYLKNPDDYVTLYRGREHYFTWQLPKTQEDLKGLGMHWTTDPRVAEHFGAGHNDIDNDEPNEAGQTPLTAGGHVIAARVHKSGIIERGTPEWRSIAKKHAIAGFDDEDPTTESSNYEKEVTIRPGTPVYVTSVKPVKVFEEQASSSLKEASKGKKKKSFGEALVDKKAVEEGGYIKKGRGTA
jgi:hypothetical protein